MEVLLIGSDGTEFRKEIDECAIYNCGRFQQQVKGKSITVEPNIIVMECEESARRVFTFRMEESYRDVTGDVPVYREMPWTLV